MCRHDSFKTVAGTHRHELAGLAREKLADRPGIAPRNRDAGENKRAGVDLLWRHQGVLVGAFDERTERPCVDRILARIGREQDVGLVKDLALAHHIAGVEPLQHDARKHEVRGGRADVDADAEQADLVLAFERSALAGKENAAAGVVGHSFSVMARLVPPSTLAAI